jgi:two-component sensor histidine kinase
MAQRIAQVVTELAINTGKHDRTGRGEGLLRVNCRRDDENVLHLLLREEGHDVPPARLSGPSGGMGLAIVASAIRISMAASTSLVAMQSSSS